MTVNIVSITINLGDNYYKLDRGKLYVERCTNRGYRWVIIDPTSAPKEVTAALSNMDLLQQEGG